MKVLFLVLAVMAAPAVSAQAPKKAVSGVVHVGDLELSSPAGRAVFDRRVASVARRICRVDGDLSLQAKKQSRLCRHQAIASARSQLAEGVTSVVVRL